MADGPQSKSAVVKTGMKRVCDDFSELVSKLGFSRRNYRSRSWDCVADEMVWTIHFHRSGSSYGAPTNHEVAIRLECYFEASTQRAYLDSDKLRDSRGYAYHLRFNALSWSMYDRCLEDLMKVMCEHVLPWFERQKNALNRSGD